MSEKITCDFIGHSLNRNVCLSEKITCDFFEHSLNRNVCLSEIITCDYFEHSLNRIFCLSFIFLIFLTFFFLYFLDKHDHFDLNCPLSALALFTMHESVNHNNIDSLPISFGIDVNHHDVTFTRLCSNKPNGGVYASGLGTNESLPLNVNEIVIVPYLVSEVKEGSLQLRSMYEVKQNLYDTPTSLYHPGKYAHPLKNLQDMIHWEKNNDTEVCTDVVSFMKKFLEPIVENTNMNTLEGLYSLYKSFGLDSFDKSTISNEENSIKSYYTVYMHLKTALCKKFALRFAVIEGGHRLVLTNKVLENAPLCCDMKHIPQNTKMNHQINHSSSRLHALFRTSFFPFVNSFPSNIEFKAFSDDINHLQRLGFDDTWNDTYVRCIKTAYDFVVENGLKPAFMAESEYKVMNVDVLRSSFKGTEDFSNNENSLDPVCYTMLRYFHDLADEMMKYGKFTTDSNGNSVDRSEVKYDVMAYGSSYSSFITKSVYKQRKEVVPSKGSYITYGMRPFLEIMKIASHDSELLLDLKFLCSLDSCYDNQTTNQATKRTTMNFGESRFIEAISGCVLHTSEELYSAADTHLKTIRESNNKIEKKTTKHLL